MKGYPKGIPILLSFKVWSGWFIKVSLCNIPSSDSFSKIQVVFFQDLQKEIYYIKRKYPLHRAGSSSQLRLVSVWTSTKYLPQPRPPRWIFSRSLASSYGRCRGRGHGPPTRSLNSRLWIGVSSLLLRWSDYVFIVEITNRDIEFLP